MNHQDLIKEAWEDRNLLNKSQIIKAIEEVISSLDRGILRIAEPNSKGWRVNEWIKKAVILYFPTQKMETIKIGPFEFHDKIPLKKDYANKQIRVVPHALARYGSFINRGVIIMPSYINIGAYVDSGTMIDTWATVGSCAQIGKNVHLSGGVGNRWCLGTCTSKTSHYRRWRLYRLKMYCGRRRKDRKRSSTWCKCNAYSKFQNH